jgi:hypothetical protein
MEDFSDFSWENKNSNFFKNKKVLGTLHPRIAALSSRERFLVLV